MYIAILEWSVRTKRKHKHKHKYKAPWCLHVHNLTPPSHLPHCPPARPRSVTALILVFQLSFAADLSYVCCLEVSYRSEQGPPQSGGWKEEEEEMEDEEDDCRLLLL